MHDMLLDNVAHGELLMTYIISCKLTDQNATQLLKTNSFIKLLTQTRSPRFI